MLVGIEFRERDLALILLRQLFQHRRQRAARGAPGRPKIDQDRHGLRALDDQGSETVNSDFVSVRVHCAMPFSMFIGKRY
jgi:hypothetical protein